MLGRLNSIQLAVCFDSMVVIGSICSIPLIFHQELVQKDLRPALVALYSEIQRDPFLDSSSRLVSEIEDRIVFVTFGGDWPRTAKFHAQRSGALHLKGR